MWVRAGLKVFQNLVIYGYREKRKINKADNYFKNLVLSILSISLVQISVPLQCFSSVLYACPEIHSPWETVCLVYFLYLGLIRVESHSLCNQTAAEITCVLQRALLHNHSQTGFVHNCPNKQEFSMTYQIKLNLRRYYGYPFPWTNRYSCNHIKLSNCV